MRKFKLFFACLLMAVLSIGQMWAAEGDVVYKLNTATTTIATANGYNKYGPASCASDQSGTAVSTASWKITLGSKQTNSPAGLWLGTNSGNASKMKLSNGSLSEAAAIATALGVNADDTYYTALVGETNLPNVKKVTLTYSGYGNKNPSKAWILYSTDNGTSWSIAKNVTSLSNTGTDFEFDATIESARYALVVNHTAWFSVKVPVLTFYEGATGGTPTCATPTFSPAVGTYASAQNVTISCATEGATIHYTTDGTDPTTSSPTYSSAIPVSATTTIKALAEKSGLITSAVASATYTIVSIEHAGTESDPYTVADARNAIAVGGDLSNKYVAGIISQVDEFNSTYSSITYWIVDDLEDTTAPLEVYSGKGLNGAGFSAVTDLQVADEVTVKGTLKLYNTTYEFDKNNQLVSFNRPGSATPCATPTFSPAEGEYTEAQNVTISCATDGATIYYTTDGTEPSTSSSKYTSAIAVSENTTIQAIAVKDGLSNSAIASATYTITTGGNPTVTFDYADYKGEGTSSSGSEYTMVKTDIVSIGGTKFYGNNSYAHFYANGTITITPATGYTITKIVLTASGEGYNGYQSSGVITASTGTMSHDGVTVIWEGSADAEFTLENNKQIRWTSIVVTYEAPDSNAPVLSVAPNVIDFGEIEQGETVSAKKVAVNFANLTGDVTYSVSSPFSAAGTISTTGDEITISANTETVGEYSETLTVTSAADSKSATVTVTMNVVPAITGDVYNKLTGSIEEGDYVIFYNGKALKNTVTSNRFGYEEVTPVNNKISDPDASIIWSISQSGEHWSISGTGEFDVTNKYQADNSKNAYLRGNGTYGFACYAEGTGGKLILYKAVNSKAPAGLAYTATSVEKVVGTAKFINAITNDNNLTIAYASNNPEVATVDAATGEVTIVAAGIAEITASTEGDETHKAGSAKYTICVTAHAGSETDPYTVADAKIVIDALGTKPNVYASGIISQVDAIDLTENFYATYWITADGLTEGQQLEAYHGKYLDNANFSAEDDIKVGDAVVIYGNLKKYNSTYEFDGGNYLISLDRTKVAAGLAYTVASVDKEVGDAKFTNELTNPNNVTVAYSSSDASVASVDAATGEVTVNAMGSATITATFAGNGSYLAGSASYTVNVSDPNITKVTFDATVDMTTGSEVLTLTKNGVTMEISKGQMHNGTSYRLNKDNTLTLSCADGLITRIELEGTDPSYAVTNITATNYSNGVWTGSAESVDLVASIAQARMTKINVYYGADSRAEAGLAWNPATDIELTVGDPFTAPELKNPNSIDAAEISIESSNTDVATVTAGVVELVENATGEATITASFAGNATYKSASVSYKITVNAVVLPPTGTTYHKVTATADITDGEYLIVYEDENVAFNGNLTALDAAHNTIGVVISGDEIAGNSEIDAAVFTIDVANGTLRAHMGDYIGVTSYGNGLKQNANAETYPAHSFSIDGEGNAIISLNDSWTAAMILNYNKAVSDKRFRYYKSASPQQAIQLYKKENAEPVYETIRSGLTPGRYYTVCYDKTMKEIKGASLWSFNGKDANMAYIVEENLASYPAGTPYLIYAESDKLEAITEEVASPTATNNNGLYGTLTTLEHDDLVATGATHLLINGDAGSELRPIGNGGRLIAKRAYVILGEIPNTTPSNAPGKRVRAIPMHQDAATGIDELNASEKPVKMIIDGQLYILRGEKMYDATGRLVK